MLARQSVPGLTLTTSVPVISVADIADGRHGDAAFADNLVIIGYSRRF